LYYIISNMAHIDVRIVKTSSKFRVTSNLRKLDPSDRRQAQMSGGRDGILNEVVYIG
jgi:hypothetical protein